ncbi:DUF1801 domain-containing protein [Sphingobacterium suaedae]|uniref:DUF1801 domain-containing protein n=1 Tax=Sphingobacterium suaedae TaxID=1686402 RepID=A0ABW5KH01_9SPHI
MTKNKTTFTAETVSTFIQRLTDETKRTDSLALISLMEEVSGESARMFGPSIIGFGKYKYTYASGHTGEAPLIGFSPRKDAISLYVYTESDDQTDLLDRLGKFKMGKACIYVKKLADINTDVLVALMQKTIDFLSRMHERTASSDRLG